MGINTKGSLIAGVLAAIGASACCVGPLVLLSVGLGGAWVVRLTSLEPFRPFFSGITLIFLGMAYYKLYFAAAVCLPGDVCADDKVVQRQRLLFWMVAIPVLALLAFPYFAPLFY